MKKEECFEHRDKLHSFVREHKPIPSFARSISTSKKRKNLIIDVQRRKSICVIETSCNNNICAELNTKQSLRKRHRSKSPDAGINKYYSKSESNDDDSGKNMN